MSREQLSSTMLDFLQGLGLPRRAGEGCLHCHEGSLDTPRSEWDFASDARPAKAVARRMISMVQAINDEHLGGLGRRAASTFRVGCETCHAGRVDPRPLLVRLTEEYEAGGTASAVELYRDLRRRFFGADAYDFRVDVLGRFADGLAERGRYDDARAFAEANEEAFPDDPVARRYTVRLGIQRALDERGAAAAVMEFERMRESEPPEVMVLGILDAVGWRTFRLGRETDALVLFRANRAAFPDEYFTFESLNEALAAAGEISRAELVRRYEAWLVEHPGHEMAKAQLTNSRRRR